MLTSLQILTVILVAAAMTPALAHALESPGKRRLSREAYVAVQRIYYPGFTFAGIAEPVSVIATTVLLVMTQRGTTSFWLTLVGFLCLACMHAVYWLVTHPVNKVWLKDEKLGGAGDRFFSAGSSKQEDAEADEWTQLRDRWEKSHLARAVLAAAAFVVLLIAVSPAA
jgi:Domain of unknown function (DUF1772)